MYGGFQGGETANGNFWSTAAIIPPKKHIPPSFLGLFFFFFSSLYSKVSTTGPSGKEGLVARNVAFDASD